mgnify:CR=1 FL=1
MVLDRQDHHLHAGRFHGFAPLVRVEFFQVEDFRVFLSASPFQAGETVRPEMDEGDEFVLQRRQLVGRRHDMGGFRDDVRVAVACFDLDRVLKWYLLVLGLPL